MSPPGRGEGESEEGRGEEEEEEEEEEECRILTVKELNYSRCNKIVIFAF